MLIYSVVATSTLTNESRGAFLKSFKLDKVIQPQLVQDITRKIMPISCLKNCGIYVTIKPQGKEHINIKKSWE